MDAQKVTASAPDASRLDPRTAGDSFPDHGEVQSPAENEGSAVCPPRQTSLGTKSLGANILFGGLAGVTGTTIIFPLFLSTRYPPHMLRTSRVLTRSLNISRVTLAQARFASTEQNPSLVTRLTQTFLGSSTQKMPDLIQYRIFKYDPQVDNEPHIQAWYLEYSKNSPMLLDDLFRIKNEKDEGLAFRRSCREGICGSCAMNVNGKNALACTYKVGDHVSYVKPYISVYPLPHMPIVKDLAVDMKHFYMQYKSIDPFLKQVNPLNMFISKRDKSFQNSKHENLLRVTEFKAIRPKKENLQSKQNRALIDGLYECILCACCSTSCPSYWWNRDKYLGPAVLLQAYRWVVDSRDRALKERLDYLNDIYRLYRCHTILNCVKCCPKSLSPAEAISNIKSMISLI